MAQRKTELRQAGGKRGDHSRKSVAGEEYTPRTEFGRKLMALRGQMVKDGVKFLTDGEIEREIAERRGGYYNGKRE